MPSLKTTFAISVACLVTLTCDMATARLENEPPPGQDARTRTRYAPGSTAVADTESPARPAQILLPDTYRIYDETNPTRKLNQDWLDLYSQGGEFGLGEPDFEIEAGYNECVEIPTLSIKSRRDTLLFVDHPRLVKGKVPSLPVTQRPIWPKEKIRFDHGGIRYTIRAEGKIEETSQALDESGDAIPWHVVSHYRLLIKTDASDEQEIVDIPYFQGDAYVSLVFAGDIDRDGKLDFIFSAPRNYEEHRILLFLSSEANHRDALGEPLEETVGFDC